MKTIIIFILSSLLYISNLSSQVTQEWVARYNGSGEQGGEAIAIDNSGNVYVTGSITSNFPNLDYQTIKYNSNGVEQWVASYNGPGNARASDIAIDGSGNVYITGGGTDYATVKYNSNGAEQWAVRYNGTGDSSDRAYAIIVDNSGNVYVTGSSIGIGTNEDYTTVKYNSNGVEQWAKRYNRSLNYREVASDIEIDNLGNIYVTGYFGDTMNKSDYGTIKYNSIGVQQWVAIYNGPSPGSSQDYANAIVVDGSGSTYVTGHSDGNGTSYDYATIKYNTNGVEQWVKRYNGPDSSKDDAHDIAIDGTGNVYVTGRSSGITTDDDFTTIKYNSNGVEQWVADYRGPGGAEQAESIAVDGSGNVYVTGFSNSNGPNTDYLTIKYNSDGLQQWLIWYNGPANGSDSPSDIAIDGMGNIYVVGYSQRDSLHNADLTTIKYSQTVGIHSLLSEMPEQFSLSQNHPNPFNPTTNIEFSIPKQAKVKIIVYDSQGKEVDNLLNQSLSAGSYRVDFDGTNFASGIYFYKLVTDDFMQTKSMVLLK